MILALTLRKKLDLNSKIISRLIEKQVKIIQESFGNIREIIISDSFSAFIKSFKMIDEPMRYRVAENSFIAAFPRYAFEAIGIILICLLALSLYINDKNPINLLPTLGAFAFGSQKLLPAFQQSYSCWAAIKSRSASLEKIETYFNLGSRKLLIKKNSEFKFLKSFELRNVSFSYKKGQYNTLRNCNFKIAKGQIVGIIGKTGSGKSTLLDIIMCLLPPKNGSLYIDDVDLYDNNFPNRISSWQNIITHVPQNIYMADITIAENIAFGIEKKNINLNKLIRSTKLSCIYDFIKSLPNGFETRMGERGINLSGGQRQRIAIARALYTECNLLILDEATSALDQETEKKVIDSIMSLNEKISIIIVSHKYSTLRRCSKIYEINKGLIKINNQILTESKE